jgi:propionyl-CoA carboxylase beta chain
MNSKHLGADLTFAWSRAELGIMGAHQAVGIVNRRDIEHADDPAAARERLAVAYANRHLGAEAAAQAGHIDDVIRPDETRARLASALALTDGSERGARGRTTNIPL